MQKVEIEKLIVDILGEGSKIERQLLGGMMNISYIVKDKYDKEYVLYIPTEHGKEMVNRELEKNNQKIVMGLGITSKNIYFDTKTGIKMNEYIPGTSIDKTAEFDYEKIAKMFHTLHNSIMLSEEDYNPFDRFVNNYEKEALTFNHPNPLVYEEIKKFVFSKRMYLEGQIKFLCHNDAQRSNIIKDNNGNYFFIDFEFMANNDPIYDIAAFGNGVVSEGRKLLNAYYQNNPNEDQIKRFYLWRMFISLQWYNVAISKHYRGEGKNNQVDFLAVMNHFLYNAKDAYDGYRSEIGEENMNNDIDNQIIATLNKIRHFLQKDGGDCEFVSFKDGIVYVKMVGACDGCAYAGADIKELVEVILQEEVPGVVEVRLA